MSEITAEQFAQRAFDLNLLDARQLESIWSEFGRRDVPIADFRSFLVRREFLTNFQVERLLRGERSGYFYGDYKMLYLVGTGTFARVYRAAHKTTGDVVAVKALRKRFSENIEQREQFLREGEMGRALRHPNIAPIYEVHSEGTIHFLVMEFVEGHNLREFVRVRRKLDVDTALRLITDIVSGLAYAAEKGITHRDLKMSNVLVSSTGRAKLVDFGLAAAASRLTDETVADCPNPRTIDYAALERATGVRKDDPRSDVYFTGCILYHMLTGKPPLYESRDRIQRLSITRFQEIIPITTLDANLPAAVVKIVNKAMELNPKRRYPSPGEMLGDLKLVAHRLEQGDGISAEGGDADSAGGARAATRLEGIDRTLMIVEVNVKIQDMLRDGLKKFGYRVLVIGDPERAIQRFGDGAAPAAADCVIFSAHELGEQAIDAFNRFGMLERTKDVPAVLLLDERQRSLQSQGQIAEHRQVVCLPLKLQEFRAVLFRLIKPRAGQPERS